MILRGQHWLELPITNLRLFAWLSGMPCICAQSSRAVHRAPASYGHYAELQHRVRRGSIAPGDNYAHSLHRAGWNLRHEADSAIKSKGCQSLQNPDTRETGRDWPVKPTTRSESTPHPRRAGILCYLERLSGLSILSSISLSYSRVRSSETSGKTTSL